MEFQYQVNPQPLGELSEADRATLARMIIVLFRHWELAAADQLALLGLSESNRGLLSRYERGDPLGKSRDLIDRVNLLLAIHKNLRLIFPHNRDLAYSWMSKANLAFDGQSPVQVVRGYGLVGLHFIRAHLDQARGG